MVKAGGRSLLQLPPSSPSKGLLQRAHLRYCQPGRDRRNIYWYFSSKEEILATILKDYLDAYEQMLVQAETAPGNAIDKVMRLIENQISMLDLFEENVNIFISILGHGGSSFLEGLGVDPLAAGMRFHQYLHAILEEAMREGGIPAQEPGVLAACFFSFFNGLIITYRSGWKQIPAQLIGEAALRLLGYVGKYPIDI
jgi:AcrR family transcriptional regulator